MKNKKASAMWFGAISASLFSFRAIGLPIVSIRCAVQDEITDPKGFSTIATTEGVVNDATPSIELKAGSWMGINSIADISKENNGSLTIKLGDYCGERYHETNFPTIGSGIHDVFSYGRDEKGYWKRIILDCHEE